MNSEQLKEMSRREFTQAAEKFESDHAGVYALCKKDYPDILAELEKEPFDTVLDAGCGPAPMLALLSKKYPAKHYTGLDLTPKMIEVAKLKNLPNTELLVGDCENLPFAANTFDVIICSMSFHHYPHPQDFFNSVQRCLKPNGRLLLRDMTTNAFLRWFINMVEMPLCHLLQHGDVHCYGQNEIQNFCSQAHLKLETYEQRPGMRLHAVIRKVAE